MTVVGTEPLFGSPDRGEIELSIIMPCLNEAETLAACIEEAKAFLVRSGVHGEIIVADNGSSDGSQAMAHALGARVVDVPIRGYGAAISEGASQARGRYAIMGDSDQSYDFLNLEPFLEKLRAGQELVMGNRFLGGIAQGAMPWKNRWIGNPALSAIGRLFFSVPCRDFHCGLRGFSLDAFHRLGLHTTGMEFASEMVIKAKLKGQKIAEVPTVLRRDGRSRPPHLRPWRDGWRHLRFMLLCSPNWLFIIPGFVVAGFGLILTLRLLLGPLHIGSSALDVHSLAFSVFFTLGGIQALLFGLFARVYASTRGFLPPDPSVEAFSSPARLEQGLMIGLLLLCLGFFGAVLAFTRWGAASFGALAPDELLRMVFASVLSLGLGLQIILGSFFLGVLMLGIREETERARRERTDVQANGRREFSSDGSSVRSPEPAITQPSE